MKLTIKLDSYAIASINAFGTIDATDVVKDAFLAGWNKSGEGFNSEHGCSETKLKQITNEYLKEMGAEDET
jgi:hypothetical protein